MTTRGRNNERGSQTLEFTMIGLPLLFLLFSIANMCFAMMTMHTLQESIEQGARFVATRGSTCASGTNTCSVTVQQIAGVVSSSAPGIAPANLVLNLIPASGTTITCNPVSVCLSSCSASCSASRSTVWPTSTSSDNSPGKDIIVTGDVTNLPTPMFMFWTMYNSSPKIGKTTFHAYSRQRLMF